MFNPSAYENSLPGGIAVLEITGDGEAEGSPRFVPLKRTHLTGEVDGPVAQLALAQTYGYSREQCEQVLEAVYRFPLPGDAAITGVRVSFGDVEIHAHLAEREQAQEEYDQAKQSGRQAALLTRESPDVFTLQVAGIRPDEEIRVVTEYVQLARPEAVGWSLRIPLTTAPRYVRSDELTSRHAQGQPLAVLRDAGHRFSLDLTVRGTREVHSSTHPLDTTVEGALTRVRLQGREVLPDRDCLLSWQPFQYPDRPALAAMVHQDPADNQLYFLALVSPPSSPERQPRVEREMILLVDHSGSMNGPKWEAADWAVKQFLSGLDAGDYFNLGLFHSTTRWFSQNVEKASPGAIRKAIEFLERHRDSGGTELGVALEQSLNLKRTAGRLSRHVLVITDAEVSDSGRILRLADEESREKERRRISVLCIDAAPNSFLANELAERGGGTSHFLTSEPEEEDITTALDEVLAEWAAPALANLHLEVNRPGAVGAGRDSMAAGAGRSGLDLGDLPAGRSVWVAGRAPTGQENLEIRLVQGQGQELARCSLRLGAGENDRPALRSVFGARQVLGLEFLAHANWEPEQVRKQLARLGYDPDQALSSGGRRKVYAENQRQETQDALHDLLVRESLKYNLACSETAFVAVREEAGKPVEGTVAVANTLAQGWSGGFLSAPFGGPMLAASYLSMAAPPSPSASFSAYVADPGDAMSQSYSAPLMDAPPSARSRGGIFGGFSRASRAGGPAPAANPLQAASAPPSGKTLFQGIPAVVNGEAVLFDSSSGAGRLADNATLTRLEVRFPTGAPQAVDSGLTLLLYVGDLASPRARVKLSDLLRQGGSRPLNIHRKPGEAIRLVLQDPAGAWATTAPALEVVVQD